MAATTKLITLGEITALAQQVETLRMAIADLRAELAPLQAAMDEANREYQAEIRPLHQLYRQLTTKITAVPVTPRPPPLPGSGAQIEVGDIAEDEQTIAHSAQPQLSADAVQKDELVEYLVWVVYPSDASNQSLLSKLQGMNRDGRFTLADMLEELPFSLLKQETPTDAQNLAQRQQRLTIWVDALTARLNELKQRQQRLENSSQYALLQQRRQGEQAWRAYLDRQKQEWQQKIDRWRATSAEGGA